MHVLSAIVLAKVIASVRVGAGGAAGAGRPPIGRSDSFNLYADHRRARAGHPARSHATSSFQLIIILVFNNWHMFDC